MATSGIVGLKERILAFDWRSVVWTANGFFLVMTIAVAQLPGSSSAVRQGAVQYLAQFTLAEEKNLATYWQGWCFLLVSILAFERSLQAERSATYERQSWLGLAALSAGLSLDELGSIHERAAFLFGSWGLSGGISSNIPFAVPAVLLLIFTLRRMWRLGSRRRFWLTLSAFTAFGFVALQEYLEHAVAWPWWVRGMRFAVEEGTELFGIFLLLSVVASTARTSAKSGSVACLVPNVETLVRLRPAVVGLTAAGLIPLSILTYQAIDDVTHRGIPAAWLPFLPLNLASMAAWASAQRADRYKRYFYLASFLAFIFSLDQIILFQRMMDKNLIRGELGSLMFPCMAAVCLAIPSLRTRANLFLLGMLLLLSPFLMLASDLLAWLVIPIQSVGVYYILASGLAVPGSAAPQNGLHHGGAVRCGRAVG